MRLVQTLRNVSQFDSLPDMTTEVELEALHMRRELERDLICEKDEMKAVTNDEKQQTVYFISAKWLSEWKMFISNNNMPYASVRVSANPTVGVLPPG